MFSTNITDSTWSWATSAVYNLTTTVASRFSYKFNSTRGTILFLVILHCVYLPLLTVYLMSRRASRLHWRSQQLSKQTRMDGDDEVIDFELPSELLMPVAKESAEKVIDSKGDQSVDVNSSSDIDLNQRKRASGADNSRGKVKPNQSDKVEENNPRRVTVTAKTESIEFESQSEINHPATAAEQFYDAISQQSDSTPMPQVNSNQQKHKRQGPPQNQGGMAHPQTKDKAATSYVSKSSVQSAPSSRSSSTKSVAEWKSERSSKSDSFPKMGRPKTLDFKIQEKVNVFSIEMKSLDDR